jgi:hypothetical protein
VRNLDDEPVDPVGSSTSGAEGERGVGSSGLAVIGNAVLILYATDGLVCLADHLLQGTTGASLLVQPRNLVAFVTLLALALVWIILAVTPRLPKRFFVAPLAVSAWWTLGAPPLPLLLKSRQGLDALGVAAELASAALAFLLVRTAYGRYLLDPARLVGPAFRLRSSAGFLLFHLLLLPPLIAGSALFGAAAQIEQTTAGFVTFHGREIRIHERRYRRGDREVRLVGMMHLGEADSYRELFRSFRGPSTVVLEEGVSDQDRLLRQPLSYAAAATALGLSTQPEVEGVLDEEESDEGEMPDVRNADVDLRDFHPETITVLGFAAAVWSAQNPGDAIAKLRAFARRGDAKALLAKAGDDILTLRNRRLLDAIDESLDSYRCVIVPWGALHLAAIEAALKERGFVQEDAGSRTLLRYATVVQALRNRVQWGEVGPVIRGDEEAAPAPESDR